MRLPAAFFGRGRNAAGSRISLEPVLPLSRTDHVRRQKPVRDRMREDAIPKIARADYPPVVNDSSRKAHIPEGSVLGSKEDGRQPERRGRKCPQRRLFEILRIDDPPHQPAAPEQLFENRHGHNADGNTKEKEYWVVF